MTRGDRVERLHGIYLIVNEGGPDPTLLARAALESGVRIVQYRAKSGIVAERLRALRCLTVEFGALLVLDDDARAAVEFDCDGVHLGPDDPGFADVAPLRSALKERVIGLSCGTVAEAQMAGRQDVDYLGVGAVFATGSKPDAGDPIGIQGLRDVAQASRFPVAAIGGIGPDNLAAVARTGVAMAAVIAAVASESDPAASARLVRIWDGEAAP